MKFSVLPEILVYFPRVLLQVNVAGGTSKIGFSPQRLLSQVRHKFLELTEFRSRVS